MKGKRRYTGHVLLPYFGVAYAVVFFFPWIVLINIMMKHWAAIHQAAGQKPLTFTGFLMGSCCVGLPLLLVAMILPIAIAIFVPCLEADSQNAGLGVNQYWSGKTLREKISREVARFGLLALSLVLGYWTALKILPHGMAFEVWGSAAFGQAYLILIFMLVIAPIRRRWPNLLFRGDPSARYHHVW